MQRILATPLSFTDVLVQSSDKVIKHVSPEEVKQSIDFLLALIFAYISKNDPHILEVVVKPTIA